MNKRTIAFLTTVADVFNQSAVNFIPVFIPNCHNKNTRKFNISDIKFFDLFFKREKKDETC